MPWTSVRRGVVCRDVNRAKREARLIPVARNQSRQWLFVTVHGIDEMEVRLDRERESARIGDREVNLTGAEFRLLARLADSPGNPVSRQQLADAVTEGNALIGERAVDVHVAAVRKKLARPDVVQTVRGVGYRLVEQ